MNKIKIILISVLINICLSLSSNDVVGCAKKQLGKTFVYGASGPDTFDTAGLIKFCNGGDIPNSLHSQAAGGQPGDGSPGDIAFFVLDDGKKVNYGGICTDKKGQMIHAQSGKVVSVTSYTDSGYWETRFLGYRRYWN